MKYKLWVFLGNPGREYARTRHNAGWQVLDLLSFGAPLNWQTKFKGEWASVNYEWGKLLLLKPQVFMNLSGESVVGISDFFKIKPSDITAVHDDLETGLGEVRWQMGGGLGGHKGLRSIKDHLGTSEFARVRVGIGRPVHTDVSTFVLTPFTTDEQISLSPALAQAGELLMRNL